MRLPPRLEDYLETIYLLEVENGEARVKDIARLRNVRMPTVSEVLRRLSKKGLIDYRPYGIVRTTEKGKLYAQKLFKKHQILKAFLKDVLFLPEDRAEVEGCLLEHVLSDDTIDRLERLKNFIEKEGLVGRLRRALG